jgi:phage baseplate assembly protein W
MATRQDFAFPFIISTASGQAAQAAYQDHVAQMIEQVLLTDPGERVCNPTFGAGLKRLLFAPTSAQLTSTTQIVVTQALNQWLSNQITVQKVIVATSDNRTSPGDTGPAAVLPDGAILITVQYVLIETQTVMMTQVRMP